MDFTEFLIQFFAMWFLMGTLAGFFTWVTIKVTGSVVSKEWDHVTAQVIAFLIVLVTAISIYH